VTRHWGCSPATREQRRWGYIQNFDRAGGARGCELYFIMHSLALSNPTSPAAFVRDGCVVMSNFNFAEGKKGG
jgi:hypothetical protein